MEKEIQEKEKNAISIFKDCKGIIPRKKISFRKDYYKSIKVLAEKWSEILASLDISEKSRDYSFVINYIGSIEGLVLVIIK